MPFLRFSQKTTRRICAKIFFRV